MSHAISHASPTTTSIRPVLGTGIPSFEQIKPPNVQIPNEQNAGPKPRNNPPHPRKPRIKLVDTSQKLASFYPHPLIDTTELIESG
jgi:hypothetical protein